MLFNFYSNSFNQFSKGYAKGLFVVGLLLIGFGTLVWILKEVLAVIAAAIFIVAGFVCCFSAIRIFIGTIKTNKDNNGRNNVKIRIEQDADL
jgi:cobalamin biosynthesis protein CobD/CbiB